MAVITRYSNTELLNLPDCAGLTESGKCRFLNVTACLGESCAYRNKTSSLSRSANRLCSLDEALQERIAKKYYGGHRPWAEQHSVKGGTYDV